MFCVLTYYVVVVVLFIMAFYGVQVLLVSLPW